MSINNKKIWIETHNANLALEDGSEHLRLGQAPTTKREHHNRETASKNVVSSGRCSHYKQKQAGQRKRRRQFVRGVSTARDLENIGVGTTREIVV